MSEMNGFPCFPQFPAEIRLMVEAIWSHREPHVIEATIGLYNTDVLDSPNLMALRLTCRLSTWMQCISANFGRDPCEEGPVEECPQPAALQICAESRMHALETFVPMLHAELPRCGFYFNPSVDVFCFTSDTGYESELFDQLRDYYGNQIDLVERALVNDTTWSDGDHIVDSVNSLKGLRILQLVIDHRRDIDGTFSVRAIAGKQEYLQIANELRRIDQDRLGEVGYTIQYVDYRFNVYAQL